MPRKGRNERYNRKSIRHFNADPNGFKSCIVCPVGVLVMNEITRTMVENGIVPEVIFDKLEEYKTAVEWMETFKFQFKKFCEEQGFNKWETDYFLLNYIGETTSVRVDTKRMKETPIYIVNATTGEFEEVNAYEFFSKKSTVKPHVTYKEKK